MITDDDLDQEGSGSWVARPAPQRGRRITAVILAVVLLPLVVLGTSVGWFFWELNGHGKPGKVVHVTLDRGWGVPRIAKELQHDGVIGSALVFNVYTRLHGDNSFQAGTYDLHTNLGVKDAVKGLQKGPRIDYVVLRVPPGLWMTQIAERVGRLGGREAASFLQDTHNNSVRSFFEPKGVTNLEGLVRPDTYDISGSQDEISVLQTMVTAFDKHAIKLGLASANVEGHTAYDTIKVASLIEAEAKVPQDRPLIASVIYNRLRANMPLQIDSTVIYGRGDHTNRKLTPADLQNVKSPYNTYLHPGLPPTPIGSVSDASLLAAMAPAQTDYLYYVLAGKDGHHAFASTLEQQQANIAAAKAAGVL
jgi:peptidoglycan lytic transglycosylase G